MRLETFTLENGSSQGQKLALVGVFVPFLLGSGGCQGGPAQRWPGESQRPFKS